MKKYIVHLFFVSLFLFGSVSSAEDVLDTSEVISKKVADYNKKIELIIANLDKKFQKLDSSYSVSYLKLIKLANEQIEKLNNKYDNIYNEGKIGTIEEFIGDVSVKNGDEWAISHYKPLFDIGESLKHDNFFLNDGQLTFGSYTEQQEFYSQLSSRASELQTFTDKYYSLIKENIGIKFKFDALMVKILSNKDVLDLMVLFQNEGESFFLEDVVNQYITPMKEFQDTQEKYLELIDGGNAETLRQLIETNANLKNLYDIFSKQKPSFARTLIANMKKIFGYPVLGNRMRNAIDSLSQSFLCKSQLAQQKYSSAAQHLKFAGDYILQGKATQAGQSLSAAEHLINEAGILCNASSFLNPFSNLGSIFTGFKMFYR